MKILFPTDFSFKGNTFVTEASDHWHGVAMPQEFGIRNPETGRTVVFQFKKTEIHGEEISGFTYKSVRVEGPKMTTHLPALTALILND